MVCSRPKKIVKFSKKYTKLFYSYLKLYKIIFFGSESAGAKAENPDIIMFFTDGASNDFSLTLEEARKTKEAGATIIGTYHVPFTVFKILGSAEDLVI